jgi:hypothetical protein
LVIGNGLLTVVAVLAKLMHWEFSQAMLTAVLLLFFSTWVIIFADLLKNNIYNKSFWLSSMFFLPSILPILYLIQRNKLIAK